MAPVSVGLTEVVLRLCRSLGVSARCNLSCAGPHLTRLLPDRNSLARLVGAVLAEQHDDWIEGRRYLGLDVLARSRQTRTAETAATIPPEALSA